MESFLSFERVPKPQNVGGGGGATGRQSQNSRQLGQQKGGGEEKSLGHGRSGDGVGWVGEGEDLEGG